MIEVYAFEVKYWTLEQAEAMPDWPSMEEDDMAGRKTGRMPNHGEWFIEDQTRTDNGYALLRYCAVLPRIGWHNYGNFGSVEEAIIAKRDFRGYQVTSDLWPAVEASR